MIGDFFRRSLPRFPVEIDWRILSAPRCLLQAYESAELSVLTSDVYLLMNEMPIPVSCKFSGIPESELFTVASRHRDSIPRIEVLHPGIRRLLVIVKR